MAVDRIIYSWQDFSLSLFDSARCLYVNDVQGQGLGTTPSLLLTKFAVPVGSTRDRTCACKVGFFGKSESIERKQAPVDKSKPTYGTLTGIE
jgi:hypothetical protein